jgi:hypothetical protein
MFNLIISYLIAQTLILYRGFNSPQGLFLFEKINNKIWGDYATLKNSGGDEIRPKMAVGVIEGMEINYKIGITSLNDGAAKGLIVI